MTEGREEEIQGKEDDDKDITGAGGRERSRGSRTGKLGNWENRETGKTGKLGKLRNWENRESGKMGN